MIILHSVCGIIMWDKQGYIKYLTVYIVNAHIFVLIKNPAQNISLFNGLS